MEEIVKVVPRLPKSKVEILDKLAKEKALTRNGMAKDIIIDFINEAEKMLGYVT